MYSDADLDAAVAAGVLDAQAVATFRAHVAGERSTPMVDEEQFRLITGFNDIFVVIASILVLSAVGWIGTQLNNALGAAAVVLTAWALAEYFTRVRRMALPSIVLLLAFVAAAVWTALLVLPSGFDNTEQRIAPLSYAVAAALGATAAWLHWQRFQVPITVAAGTAALASVALFLVASVLPADALQWLNVAVFLAGSVAFVVAMRWDLSDPQRQTQRSDVAFWLHLVAAPLMVQPIFALVGLLGNASDLLEALVVVMVYLVIGVIALIIDRRALLVSALAFLLSALSGIFEAFGAVDPNIALAALLIGSALLLLSAFWDTTRAVLVRRLPQLWQARLPAIAA
jgi:hypothetical protein